MGAGRAWRPVAVAPGVIMWSEADRETFIPASTRLLRDQAVVDGNLPSATRHRVVDGVRGWLYPVTSELGDAVQVVEPALEGRADLHACHLFRDARICLGERAGGGMPTLAEAFSKSVVWCNGFSVYQRTARFPF
jgi:hypothetical protein